MTDLGQLTTKYQQALERLRALPSTEHWTVEADSALCEDVAKAEAAMLDAWLEL